MPAAWVRRAAALVIASAVAAPLASCSSADHGRDTAGRDVYPYWEKGAGAEQAAAFMDVPIPDGAKEIKGAVRVQPRERVHLLSFVTEGKLADLVVEDLHPEKPLKEAKAVSSLSGDGFEHLGLTAPQEVPGIRTTSTCPPCAGDPRRGGRVQAIEVHVDDLAGGRARVYLAGY
ncbi:hypothetical protein [Streptomyces sp. NPDC001985]|uniref:hypothetical protein n=1 Tax=Streptomyces sp. NPDC001985 TaxID=3154406 RepID=UPI0033198270